MAGGEITWNEETMNFDLGQTEEAYTTYLHLADNTIVFHFGANPLQDVAAAIGDMRAEASGVNNILVTNRSISLIDAAIERASAWCPADLTIPSTT